MKTFASYGPDEACRIDIDNVITYRYEVGDGDFCAFHMFCEVGAPYQPRFESLIEYYGLLINRGVMLDVHPWCADTLAGFMKKEEDHA